MPFNIDTLGMQMLTSVGQQTGYNFVPVSYYGITSSSVTDWTTQINTANQAAQNLGCSLYWPPGTYLYSGPISVLVPWVSSNPSLIQIINNAVLGKGALIDCSGLSDIYFKNLQFNSPNVPSSATNNGSENDGFLRFTGCLRPEVDNCIFRNSFGPTVLMRNVSSARITRNKILTCYKDGFHVTGTSVDVFRGFNLVEDGGDDPFPVVGYNTGGSPGQPERIVDIGNVVNGCKFSYAFHYVGTKSVTNIGCKVNGTIPPQYGRAVSQNSCPALVIQVDTTFGTYGNEEMNIIGFQAVNCGRPGVVNAVQIQGAAGQTTRNININGMTIRNSASIGLFVDGRTAGGIKDLSIKDLIIEDTSDPNGYLVTAGTGQRDGFSISNTENCKIQGIVCDSGAQAGTLNINNTGRFEVDLVTRRVNAGGKTGFCRIIDGVNSASQIERLVLKLLVAEQAVANSGLPYFISNNVFFPTVGVVEELQIEYGPGVSGISGPNLPALFTAVPITASPMVYTNTSGAKQLLLIGAGTAVGLVVTRGQSGHFGTQALAQSVETILRPNESVQVVYSTAGTLAISTFPAEGF